MRLCDTKRCQRESTWLQSGDRAEPALVERCSRIGTTSQPAPWLQIQNQQVRVDRQPAGSGSREVRARALAEMGISVESTLRRPTIRNAQTEGKLPESLRRPFQKQRFGRDCYRSRRPPTREM